MMISVILPVHNARDSLERCLHAVAASDYSNYEIIVVDDCSTDGSSDIARRFPVHLLLLSGKPYGPAYARNCGVEKASGEIILFLDADVIIYPQTLGEIAKTFILHQEYSAMFGSYDEDPGESEFLSQYKNLTHHFVHQQAKQDAATFWSGCGAIRRTVFLEIGGFNAEHYPRPSIEDIDLGYRLKRAGYRIYVNKKVQVKHLKRWTLKGWIKTDILDRAIPWTRLIMNQRNLPDDLNLTKTQRLSSLLVIIMLLFIISRISTISLISLFMLTIFTLTVFSHWQPAQKHIIAKNERSTVIILFLLLLAIAFLSVIGKTLALLVPLATAMLILLSGVFLPSKRSINSIAFATLILALASSYGILLFSSSQITGAIVLGILILIVVLNFCLFSFFTRKRGIWFALAAYPFHLIYYFYSITAFAIGASLHLWETIRVSRKGIS